MKWRCTIGHPGLALVAAALLLRAASVEAEIPKAPESPYVAPSDQALLVFSRPRHRQASNVTLRIVNQVGRCLAVLDNGSQTVATVWPGTHMLLLITGTAPPTIQLLQAKVGPGKTYVVQLRARVNIKNPVQVEVLRRGDQPVEAFPPSVRDRIPAKPDLRLCTEWVSWKQSKIQPKAHQAKRNWDEASDEDRNAHTVHRKDGWTAAEVRGP